MDSDLIRFVRQLADLEGVHVTCKAVGFENGGAVIEVR